MRILFYVRSMEWLGVGYLMSYLKQHGHEVELIFDPGIDDNSVYKVSVLKYFNRWDKLIEKAVIWKPDLVAFSTVTNVYLYAIEFAKRLKKFLDVPYIFGGIQPTALPDYVLQNDEIDYVCRGEGEYAIEELADFLKRNEKPKEIRNLCYKDEGRIIINPLRPLVHDLDSLPFPTKELFYKAGAFKNVLNILTSRGCPNKCSYCIHNYLKNHLYKEMPGNLPAIRRRSPQNVINEIKLRIEQYDINHIYFTDEMFVSDRKWLYEFLDLYMEVAKGIPFSFGYHNKFIDDDIACKLSKSGAELAVGSIETANMDLKKRVLKRNDNEDDIIKAAKSFKKYGVKLGECVIFGIPHETEENRWESVRLVEKINPDIVSSFLMYPYPGTELTEIALRDGFLSEEGYEKAKMGCSAYHRFSLMQKIDTGRAETVAKLLPLYNRVSLSMRPFIKILMKLRIPRIAHVIYIITIPFVLFSSSAVKSMIADIIRRSLFGLFGFKKL